MRTIRDLFVVVAIALAFAFLVAGCESNHHVDGGQKHDVHVTHDDQNTHIWIHRDRRRHPNPRPAPKQ